MDGRRPTAPAASAVSPSLSRKFGLDEENDLISGVAAIPAD